VKWPPILDRMQQMYDDNAMEPQPNAPKIVRKVLAAALKRRQTLGMSQSPLETGKNSLQVHGIIYCIINTRSRKIYRAVHELCSSQIQAALFSMHESQKS